MALGSTEPLTEMSTRNLPRVKKRPAPRADNLTANCEPRRLTTLWAFTACYTDSFTFYKFIMINLICVNGIIIIQLSFIAFFILFVCVFCSFFFTRAPLLTGDWTADL
jgi:hypothetical protein